MGFPAGSEAKRTRAGWLGLLAIDYHFGAVRLPSLGVGQSIDVPVRYVAGFAIRGRRSS